MSKHKNKIIEVLDDLKTSVVVKRYPTNKASKLVFELPSHVNRQNIQSYMMVKHQLCRNEALFILDNLSDCNYIQPSDGYVDIGIPGDKNPCRIVNTVDYGSFRIHGYRYVTSHHDHDIDSELTSYICNNGITAYVHVAPNKSGLNTMVYYGSDIDKLLQYVKLKVSAKLYQAYITDSSGINNNYGDGEYHQSYTR